MELSEAQSELIQELLRQLGEVDPAELPGPAAELADLLGEIIEAAETS